MKRISIIITMLLFVVGAQAEYIIHNHNFLNVSLHLKASTVAFNQDNSWFDKSVANIGEQTDQWFEAALTPEINVTYSRLSVGELFGTLSTVSTKTWGESADGLAVGFNKPNANTLEQAFIGWHGEVGQNQSLEFMLGNFNYNLGTGFLINNGGCDGAERGGFYLGARKAFRHSKLVRFRSNNLLLEGFYLRNNPCHGDIESEISGFNWELDMFENTKIAATYINIRDRDTTSSLFTEGNLHIHDVRFEHNLMQAVKIEGEYVYQGGGRFTGNGWWLQMSYESAHSPYKPVVSYRYAALTGENPYTIDTEQFQSLTYGFTDYSQWYQGEIVGNWIFANSNQLTHMIKGSVSLAKGITLTGLFLNVELDEPAAINVTSEKFGNELNVFLDWEATENLFVSVALAFFSPDEAAKQFTGGDDTWTHFMLYTSYHF